MKKIIVIFSSVLFLVSCGGKMTEQDKIKEQIKKYKAEVADLNAKIAELEAQIVDTLTTTEGIKITAKIVNPEMFEHYIEATGNVEAVNDAYISPSLNGQIKKIYIDEGDFVTKGQLLVELNSDILTSTISQMETAVELANVLYKKQEELWSQNIGSELQYLEAKTNKESMEKQLQTLQLQLDLSKVYAPFAGIVDKILQKEGELAIPGVRIIQLVNLSQIYIAADISESNISSINLGDKAEITFPPYPEIKIEDYIIQKGSIIDATNRTFEIKFKITNPKNEIKPNTLSVIKMKDYVNDTALVVPSQIISKDISGFYLFRIKEENNKKYAQKVYVETGMYNDENTIITSGLSAGDIVIIDGYNMVNDGTEVMY